MEGVFMKNASDVFGSLISDSDVNGILSKRVLNHPLVYILSDEKEIYESNHYNILTQSDTQQAVRIIYQYDPEFLKNRKRDLLSNDRTSASAALGEIRCYGILLDVFGKEKVFPVCENRNTKTPDFKVSDNGVDLFIEVNTVQVTDEEYKKMECFEKTPPEFDKNGISMREYCFTPFGTKKQSGITPSIIYKLCSIKQNAEQLPSDTPGVIWVDLQEEFTNALSNRLRTVGPLFSNNMRGGIAGGIYSNEIWYSLYAPKDTAIFEGETLRRGEGFKKTPARMKIDGRFAEIDNPSKISAVVFNAVDSLALFENPNAANTLPPTFIQAVSSWRRFRIESSVLGFHNGDLRLDIDRRLQVIEKLSNLDLYSW